MVTPLSLLARMTRPAQLTPPIGRCPVCHGYVRESQQSLMLRGGIRVHRECATYRTRQLAR